jgi:hypothetical protein
VFSVRSVTGGVIVRVGEPTMCSTGWSGGSPSLLDASEHAVG